MFKILSRATALGLLFASAAHAVEPGIIVATPCPLGDCKAAIGLQLVGEFSIATGTMFDGVEFGGISGLSFDASTGRYIGISDDRSEKAPARFYELQIDASAAGITDVKVTRTVTLKDKNGEPFAAKFVDPESIRLGRDGIIWSSEGDAKQLLPPFVRIASPDGMFVREFTLPQGFAPVADKSSGIRDNLAFEGMAVMPNGDVMIAVESALNQDGPITTLTRGALSRMIRYDAATGTPKAQYAYPIAPIPQAPLPEKGWNDNGVSEILALDDHRLLVVERGFAQGFGNSIKVYMVDTDGATDVSGMPSLANADAAVAPLRKAQVLDMRAIGLVPDNIEAVTFAKGTDGSDLLVFAADNNFSKEQKTQFIAFKVLARP
ncbi:esterase-like activity of phytase family protein [Rhizobium sp. XQZ8]|uniref:esterase-like activity of phytase family protein n=1 Tax=Rhizobium populisoli TaxID=2859785 RepID=UPI001C68540B|nr:esterase-like activity of phytase family protein [Rhizobium populisoli]MBW6421236.1 esterase-like activity of phytase family protein [Rhizobium populisoli]